MVETSDLQITSPVRRTPTTPSSTTLSSTAPVKPQSFSLSALHAADFDAQAFVSERRQHAPLSLIRDDLRQYVSSLSAQIVQHLQKDFNLFTNFGPSVADATELSRTFVQSFEKIDSHLTKLDDELGVQIHTLNKSLANRQDIHTRRTVLQTLVSIYDSLIKCERLLRQYSTSSTNVSNPLTTDSLAMLDRITTETAQLSFTLARVDYGTPSNGGTTTTSNYKFLAILSNRISSIKRQVRTCLDQCLQRALPNHPKPFKADILSTVLNLYVVAGMHEDAHDFFTRQVVIPFTSQRLRMSIMLGIAERNLRQEKQLHQHQQQQQQQQDMSTDSKITVTPGDALRAAYNEIVTFIGDKVLPLVNLCQNDVRLSKRLDFIGRSVWPNVQKAIATNMASAFSPGIPDVFHRSFKAGVDIFALVENSCSNDEFRVDLRKSQTSVEFWRHWNLPVYFQLRFQEITTAFEQSLLNGPLSVTSDKVKSSTNSNQFNKEYSILSTSTSTATDTSSSMDARLLRTDVYKCITTCTLVACLRRCWSDDVFLLSLTHRFVRLSLQLIARYSTWIRIGLAGDWLSLNDTGAIENNCALILYDISTIQTRLPAELASILRSRCSTLRADMIDAIENGFLEAVHRYTTVVPDVTESISEALSNKCKENLQPLRGIVATYRLKSKQAPTKHSSFVPQILRPLRVFLKEHEQNLVRHDDGDDEQVDSGELRKKIASKVIESIAAEYLAMATESIEKNKNNEATLRRLNIGRAGGNNKNKMDAGGMSVVEKIVLQLNLDVQQFKEEVKVFNVNPDHIESLTKLVDSVQREKDSGAQQPQQTQQEEDGANVDPPASTASTS